VIRLDENLGSTTGCAAEGRDHDSYYRRGAGWAGNDVRVEDGGTAGILLYYLSPFLDVNKLSKFEYMYVDIFRYRYIQI
jgi:hypothetical protein